MAFGRLVIVGLRGRRVVGTALFVLVVAVASAAIVAGLESRHNAARAWDRAFDRADGPHVIVSAPSVEALADVADDSRVIARSGPVAQTNGELTAGDIREDVVLRAAAATPPPAVGAPFLVDGRLAMDPTELTLERSFAKDLGLDIGDQVSVANGGRRMSFSIVGIVLDFQDCFYPQCDPGVAWADPRALDGLGADVWYSVLLRLDDPSSAPHFSAETLSRYGDRLSGVQDWLDTRGDALSVDTFFGAFLAGFGVFVLIATGVVVAASVTNRVLARRRDIGLLKAVGVTPLQVVTAITVEHLALGVIGLTTGCVFGFFVSPQLRIGVTKVLIPGGPTLTTTSVTIAATALGAIIVVATALPATRIARGATTTSLRPPGSGGGRSSLARLAARSGAGPVVVAGLTDAFGRPVRAALTATSIVLAIVALLVSLGLRSSVTAVDARPALSGDPWDVTISPSDDPDPTAVLATIDATPGVAASFFEASSRRVVDGEVVRARAVGGDPQAAGYVVREGRRMAAAGEAMAGYGLLERLGRHVGDTVTLDLEGHMVPLTIVGRYAETEDSGEVLMFRWESVAALFPDAHPDNYLVVSDHATSRQELAARLSASFGDTATVQALVVDSDDLDAFFVAFWLVAGLVVTVAIVNLGSAILLGIRERFRDLGVLRTVGFTPAQLITSTALSTIAIVIVATAIGVPAGLFINEMLTSTVGKAIGYGPELGTSPGVLGATLCVTALALLAVLVGAATSVGSARRSASELTRYE
jgi:putative ABC transport system permease protein